MRPTRLIVCGAGRMGSQVAALAKPDERFSYQGGIDSRTGKAALELLLSEAEVAVDFSAPAGAVRLAEAAAKRRVAVVTGTTGFSSAQRAVLRRLARRIPIFVAPNFSPAVHVLKRLTRRAARVLSSYDVGIHEVHHAAKRDAPSGTALALSEALKLKKGAVVSQRLGAVVGEHTVTLAGPYDRLELTHRAQSRAVFARGALDAALWLRGRKPGLYGMDDLLPGA